MRTVQVIGPGGTRAEVKIGKNPHLQWAIAGDDSTEVLAVQSYAVGGLVVLVALRPGATPRDLALALLKPDVAESAQVIP